MGTGNRFPTTHTAIEERVSRPIFTAMGIAPRSSISGTMEIKKIERYFPNIRITVIQNKGLRRYNHFITAVTQKQQKNPEGKLKIHLSFPTGAVDYAADSLTITYPSTRFAFSRVPSTAI